MPDGDRRLTTVSIVCLPPGGGYEVLNISGMLSEAEADALGEAMDRRGDADAVVRLSNANSGMAGKEFSAHIMRLLASRAADGRRTIGANIARAWQPQDLRLGPRSN